jgi:hypothetical protein
LYFVGLNRTTLNQLDSKHKTIDKPCKDESNVLS